MNTFDASRTPRPQADTEATLLKRARSRVRRKTGFYIHALVFVLVNLGLLAIDRLAGGPSWVVFPFLGWGLGLAIHGVVTWVSLQGDGLGDRWVAAEVERLRQRS